MFMSSIGKNSIKVIIRKWELSIRYHEVRFMIAGSKTIGNINTSIIINDILEQSF